MEYWSMKEVRMSGADKGGEGDVNGGEIRAK